MYPTGLAGVALLVLRLTISTSLVFGASLVEINWILFGTIVISAALLFGVFTSGVAALGAMVAIGLGIEIGGDLGFAIALHGAAAVALSMLGAGGYSIDARLFGRHVITIE